jgi:DNA-binding GntR family transcriptional regulator
MPGATMKRGPRRPQGLSKIPRRGTLASQAADQIRDAIIRGELSEDRPLREEDLCRRLGISRIPLREALRQLEGQGFVEIRPRRGAIVAKLSRTDVIEIAGMCRALERHALEIALPRMTPAVLARAEELVEELDRLDDPVEWARANWDFHATLYEPAQRPRLIECVKHLRGNAERYMYMLITDRSRRHVLNQEHRAIVGACRRRNTKRAVQLLDAHLEGGKEKVLGLLDRTAVPLPSQRPKERVARARRS